MGLFKSLFGNRTTEEKEVKQLPWIPLNSESQLDDINTKSHTTPQLIFKHSTTCGISRMVLNMFQESYDLEVGDADLYFLDLHAFRGISNEVAIRFQVLHQSPQLLVVKNGETTFHTSHGAISEVDLKTLV